MIGTSKMLLEKELKSKLKNSSIMGTAITEDNSGNALYDIFDYQITRDFMSDAYKVNEWIRAIVDTITERVEQFDVFPMPLNTRIGEDGKISDAMKRRMEIVMNVLMKPNDDYESFSSLRKKVIHDLAIYDEAGIQIVSGLNFLDKKRPFALYANVTGEELYVNPNPDGTLPDRDAYIQLRGNTKISSWDKDEFINFIKNRRAGYANGLSPIESVATSVFGDLEAMNFNMKFFENNARPNIAFIFENLGFGKGEKSLERAKKWYVEKHQGKPHLPLFMGSEKGSIKLQEMLVNQKDMDFAGWTNLLLSRIMAVYGMQPFVLGVITDTTGKLNSELQSEQFKRNGIIPYIQTFLSAMNCTLIWGDGNFDYDDIYLTSVNLDIDDEKKQSEIDEKYLEKGVITINQVRSNLHMHPVPWGDEPFVPLNYSPLSVLLEWQKSRIEQNLKSQSSSGIDNQNGGKGDAEDVSDDQSGQSTAKESGLEGLWTALYETMYGGENPVSYHMYKNFKVPNGLEKVDPTELTILLKRMIDERETRLKKTRIFSPTFRDINSVANGFDLSWSKILETR